MKLYYSFFLLILMSLSLLQSTLFYQNYFYFFGAKINLTLVLLYLYIYHISFFLLMIMALVLGFSLSYFSSAPIWFYPVVYSIAIITYYPLKEIFEKIIFPIYVTLGLLWVIIKLLLESILISLYTDLSNLYYFWINKGFLELISTGIIIIVLYPVYNYVKNRYIPVGIFKN